MKKSYVSPEMKLIVLSDVITDSGDNTCSSDDNWTGIEV